MTLNGASGEGRRTLRLIEYYPTPDEILARIENPKGNWNYKGENRDILLARDNALVATLYSAVLRISEAERLTVSQFKEDPFRLVAVKLSKAEKRRRTIRDQNGDLIPIPETHRDFNKIFVRRDLYRKEIKLPEKGTRGQIAAYIKTYLALLKEYPDFKLFNIKNSRVDQIVKLKVGVPPHYLRAYAENELYDLFDNDLIAVAAYVQVDPATLAKYIHRVPKKYYNKI